MDGSMQSYKGHRGYIRMTLFITFDYSNRGGSMMTELYESVINGGTTIKYVNQCLNNHLLYGDDLNLNQYVL